MTENPDEPIEEKKQLVIGAFKGETSRRICGAHHRRGGGICHAPAMANGRCKHHGGKNMKRRGVASAHYKHGRYSKDLPVRLQERYDEALADPELLNLSKEIALVQSRLGELTEQLDTQESREFIQMLQSVARDITEGHQRNHHTLRDSGVTRLNQLLEERAEVTAIWDEFIETTENLRKLVDTETRRRVHMQNAITVEKAMALMAAFTDIVKSQVDMRFAELKNKLQAGEMTEKYLIWSRGELLMAIQDDIRDLANRPDRTRLAAGGTGGGRRSTEE